VIGELKAEFIPESTTGGFTAFEGTEPNGLLHDGEAAYQPNYTKISIMTPDDLDDHFGLCPECHQAEGFVNAGKAHFVFCKVHRLFWFVGANLFSSWKEQTEEEQRKIWQDVGMDHFDEVEPFFYPRPPEPRPMPQPDHVISDEECPF
jgi:hypothetical protein